MKSRAVMDEINSCYPVRIAYVRTNDRVSRKRKRVKSYEEHGFSSSISGYCPMVFDLFAIRYVLFCELST